MGLNLSSERAYIFRITHRDNVPRILDHGIPCRNSTEGDPHFVNIGNLDLISRRHSREVPAAPYGTLSDYVPFYFTPHSPMLYNIRTGWGGIRQRENNEIVIVASSLHKMKKDGVQFLFTDRHAYLAAAQYYSDLSDLSEIDWEILRSRDFRNDPEDPDKKERYQAEALIHRHVSIDSILGIVCYDEETSTPISTRVTELGLRTQVIVKPNWYFQ